MEKAEELNKYLISYGGKEVLPSPPLVKKKDVKLNASEGRTLENKWVRLIFNKPQITKEIREDKNIANVMPMFKKM